MEFITQNGNKKVEIKEASFRDAVNLKKAAFKCLLKLPDFSGLNINDLGSINTSKLFESLAQLIINVDTSDEFDSAIMKCLSTCIYDGFYKIDEKLFDDKAEAREDYYEIVSKCAEVNLRPFFKSLVSELKQRLSQIQIKDENQKSE